MGFISESPSGAVLPEYDYKMVTIVELKWSTDSIAPVPFCDQANLITDFIPKLLF